MKEMTGQNGMHSAPRGSVRIHPDGGTVITARMPTAGECARGYAPGVPVLSVTWPDGRSREFPADMVTLVVGDREATADQARDAALSVLGNIAEDLENTVGKLAEFAQSVRSSPGAVVSLAAEFSLNRELEFFCSEADRCTNADRPGIS